MEIYNLVVEVTRRCNMKCPHCLRGEPQNKTMKREHLTAFLKQVSYISNITFTGGEPTLPSGMRVMEDFMEICNRWQVEVGSFYFVTNAKVWRPELPGLIAALYEFCEDNEATSIEISTDQFHDRIQNTRNRFRFQLEDELWDYGINHDIVDMRDEIHYEQLLNEGRAEALNVDNDFVPTELCIESDDGNIRITDGDVYLNCDGNVINGCDWSYESQKNQKNIICSVYDSFDEAIRKIGNILAIAA